LGYSIFRKGEENKMKKFTQTEKRILGKAQAQPFHVLDGHRLAVSASARENAREFRAIEKLVARGLLVLCSRRFINPITAPSGAVVFSDGVTISAYFAG
jgi:hypothetical protein